MHTFNALTAIPRKELLPHISVIPKEGKDPTVPSSYRPILLLNSYVKILAKILANLLKLPTVIQPDQTGFIAGREVRDNSNHAIQQIHWARLQIDHPPCLLLSTDSEKVFARVDWIYLRAVLTKLGLGPNMLPWEASLYGSPEARVWVNGVLSNPFPIIERGRDAHFPPSYSHSPLNLCLIGYA